MFLNALKLSSKICANGCQLPIPKKTLIRKSNGEYTFGFNHYLFCPVCDALILQTYKVISGFFKVYRLHPKLNESKRLFLKSEFSSAMREAVIVLEDCIKQKSNESNLHVKDLVIKAFSFKYDKSTQVIVSPPQISINKTQNRISTK